LFSFMLLALFSCSGGFPEYIAITMSYDEGLVNAESVLDTESLYFEPVRSFQKVPDEYFLELINDIQYDDFHLFNELPIAAFVDSLSQMIFVSEIVNNDLSYRELFSVSATHFNDIYKDNIIASLPFRYQNILINQYLISYEDNVLVKVIFSKLNKHKLSNIYMIDYFILADNFTEKMLSVESSIASIAKKQERY